MERPFLLESLILEVGTVVANLARAGFPETGADAVKLWELETRSDVPAQAMSDLMKALGYVPFDGYPLRRAVPAAPHKIFVTIAGGNGSVCEDSVPAGYQVEIIDFDNVGCGDDFPSPEAKAYAIEHWPDDALKTKLLNAAETAAAEKRSRELYQAAIQDRAVRP